MKLMLIKEILCEKMQSFIQALKIQFFNIIVGGHVIEKLSTYFRL